MKNGHQAHDNHFFSFASRTIIGTSMYRVFDVPTRNNISLAMTLFSLNLTACLRYVVTVVPVKKRMYDRGIKTKGKLYDSQTRSNKIAWKNYRCAVSCRETPVFRSFRLNLARATKIVLGIWKFIVKRIELKKKLIASRLQSQFFKCNLILRLHTSNVVVCVDVFVTHRHKRKIDKRQRVVRTVRKITKIQCIIHYPYIHTLAINRWQNWKKKKEFLLSGVTAHLSMSVRFFE